MDRILIIEDDADISAVEKDYLEASGFSVICAEDGQKGLEEALSGSFDLVILDLMLPALDGFSICRQIRAQLDIPVIIVSARPEDADKIRSFGLGADEYIDKPFSPAVLVARVNSALTRYRQLSGRSRDESEIQVRNLKINTLSHRVFVSGNEVYLKNKEYELLLFLVLNADTVFDKETLYEEVWGMDSSGDSATVTVHINRIREKIEADPAHPQLIETVWGAGYRIRV